MKWEYSVDSLPNAEHWHEALEAFLNEAGQDGWELVEIDHDDHVAIFKRQVSVPFRPGLQP